MIHSTRIAGFLLIVCAGLLVFSACEDLTEPEEEETVEHRYR
jgi:hypothetical protein